MLERWRRLLGGDAESDIEDELSFHLEMRAAELESRGETPERARERALARFGDPEEARAGCREIANRRERRMARAQYFQELKQDLRFAVRTLGRDPVFTLVAIATLVLGIGANTAIFSVVNGVILRPLPFPEPEEVVHWGWSWRSTGGVAGAVSAYKLEWFSERAETFEAVTTYRGFTAGLGEGPDETGVRGLRVSPGFQDVVGLRLAAGRRFSPEESAPGGPAVTVISHGLWQSRFGGDPNVVGRTMAVGGESRTVIGVAGADFRFPQAESFTELLVPFRLVADPRDLGHNYSVLARLADGVDPDRAAAELTTLSEQFREAHPELMQDERERGMRLVSFQELHVGSLSGVLWTLMAAVGLVLLIACANVANLLLARTSERQRELAVRSAVGASRSRLVRQLLTESLALSAIAGVLGLALAAWATQALVAAVPSQLPRAAEVGVDVRVVAFTIAASLLTAVVFGLAAALPSSKSGVMGVLREGGRGAPGGGRMRNALVTAEAAVSLVLLVGAGLLISTVVQLRSVEAGFEPEGLMTASVSRWPDRYDDPEALAQLERRLLEGLAVPGASGAVQAVGLSSNIPLERGWNLPMEVEGRPGAEAGDVEWRSVSPGYFEALDTRLVRGRAFTSADGAGAPRVVIINEAFAQLYFPDEDPIGHRIAIGRYQGQWIGPHFEGEPAEIVGVVEDMRELSLRLEPKRTMLVPREQAAMGTSPVILIRSSRPGAAAAWLRDAFARIDSSLPAPTLRPMSEVIGESLARERFQALLMSLFAAIALVLTAVGIFGVVSYGVRRRRAEIGIRVALGAPTGKVIRMVAGQGMKPVVFGMALGLLASLVLVRFIRSMIWGVSPTDPATFVAVVIVLLSVALVASWLPARRAARADPVRTLRQE